MMMKKWFPFSKEAASPRAGGEEVGSRSWPVEMVRPFERFLEEMRGGPWGTNLERWFGDFSPQQFQPTVDVIDEKSHLRVTAEMPGMDARDIELSVEDGALILKGEKKAEETSEQDGYYRTERSFGSFRRVLPLPDNVDLKATEANCEKGVLTIRIPKTKEAEARKIPIR